MQCRACQHHNETAARFCEECGAKLGRACTACGHDLNPSAKFCPSCGRQVDAGAPNQPAAPAQRSDPHAYTPRHLADKILQSKSALEGERKQVTVLFADVKGSMELAEQLDPEAWHAILDRFFQILTEGVHRLEGTVNQYTGDGIMALFGAPIAHEDHAQRACYAALSLRDELRRYADTLRVEQGLSFSVRMGLNSGEVIVGTIGDDLRMDYTAQGHTVGLAARMEQLAEPGKVLLAENTAQLVTGYFGLRDLGASRIKGLSVPLRIYELEGVGTARTRLDVSKARGLSKFVGRRDEMAILEAALERALAGHGQVVGIVADAGMGKSRLCYELVQRCQARGIATYQAHAIAQGTAVPLLPALELLRAYFGITERDPERTARDKIAGRTVLLDSTLADALPLLFDFLGVPDPERPAAQVDADARQRQLTDLMKRLMRARGEREAAVFVIEDLHWLDDASAAFLKNFADTVAAGQTLLVVNFRPEFRARWMETTDYRQIALRPLGTELIDELLRDILGSDPSLTGLANDIHARTAGNPFFIEEVVHSLVEAGALQGPRGAYRLNGSVAAVAIPATVQAVLAARIDRLAERDKQLLQTAAVIGKQFTAPVLRRVAGIDDADIDVALRVLMEREFLYETALYPEIEYAFKHPLTQEVAYASQLSGHRRDVHARVAQALEALSEKLDERAAVIAHHWTEAGDTMAAARWHGRAAEWVETRDFTEALRHWRAVRRLLQNGPESTAAMTLRLAACVHALNVGWRLGLSAEEAEALLTEGRQLAAHLDDAAALVSLQTAFDALQFVTGRAAAETLVQAADVMGQPGARGPATQLAVLGNTVAATVSTGALRVAIDASERGLELLHGEPSLESTQAAFILRGFRILALTYLGQLEQAGCEVDTLLRRAREHERMEIVGFVHGWASFIAQCLGDLPAAAAHAQQSAQIGSRLASPFSKAIGLWNLSNVHVARGEWPEAAATCEAGLAVVRAHGVGVHFESSLLGSLAEARLGCGDRVQARATAEKAVAAARTRGQKLFEYRAHLVLARVLMETDGLVSQGAIETALAEAEALLQQTGLKNWEPLLYEHHAQLARLQGDDRGCREALRRAHRLYTDMGAAGHANRIDSLLR